MGSLCNSLHHVIHLVRQCRRKNFKLFCFLCLLSLAIPALALNKAYEMMLVHMDQGSENALRLYRDVYRQEPWPQREVNVTQPGILPPTAHFFWCGRKMFEFRDYVGLLSVIRILKPQKLVFHYSDLPVIDERWYNTWCQELRNSANNLVLRSHSSPPDCGSRRYLAYALGHLAAESADGGFYIGERTILTHLPQEALTKDMYHAFGLDNDQHRATEGIFMIKRGFPMSALEEIVTTAVSSPSKCMTIEEFNSSPAKTSPTSSSSLPSPCVIATQPFLPKDIWDSPTSFAELARWSFYGQRRRLRVEPDPSTKIPLISHLIWLRPKDITKSSEFKFLHYLSVLSALHVAGFKRVYVHGEVEPYGKWWNKLRSENVSFVKIEGPETVFQQHVGNPAHQSDILRLNILLKYGGAYQDRDVVWTGKVTDEIRSYPVVACYDWPQNGEWPAVFNMGVVLAKPNAEWLKSFMRTFLHYRDDKWAFNAVFMPYKAYEFHPDKLYVDKYLQVICFKGICHPVWHEDYLRNIADTRPITNFNWTDGRAFHFTVPKPPASLLSPDAAWSGKDIYASIGRMILTKARQTHLTDRFDIID